MKDKSWKMKLMLSKGDSIGVDIIGDVNEHTKRALVRMLHGVENDGPAWVSLTVEEIDDIIKSNITITDQRLYDGVYAVAVDIEAALLEKNT